MSSSVSSSPVPAASSSTATPRGCASRGLSTTAAPWPATNSQHTSVGVSAIRRFLRPVAYQDAPAHALPEELRDGASDIPRRIDGVLTLPNA